MRNSISSVPILNCSQQTIIIFARIVTEVDLHVAAFFLACGKIPIVPFMQVHGMAEQPQTCINGAIGILPHLQNATPLHKSWTI